MSIVITTDVFCDGDDCSQWVQGVTGQRPQAEAASHNAQRRGWVFSWGRPRRDLCPDCRKALPTPSKDQA